MSDFIANDTALIVMNAREIPDAIMSIRSLTGVDLIWASYYSEVELETVIPEVIANTYYKRYMIISDDTVVTQGAVESVLMTHDQSPEAVACGWVNVDNTGDRSTYNPEPLRHLTGGMPPASAYGFASIDQTRQLDPRKAHRTYFHGMVLATMSRELWQRYPFGSYAGCASDYHQCLRLQLDDVPIWTHPDAYVYHLKEIQNRLDKNPVHALQIGKRPSRVMLERQLR